MIKRFSKWGILLALLLIAFFSYGIFIFQQGFHWDDWGFAWLIRTLGKPGLFDYFATNRPFLAYVYSVTTSLFGANPLPWHLFSLLMRWLTAVSLLWVLRLIWPERPRETFLATVFFLVYPGFNQQAIAITYSHFFLAQTLLFVSIGLMILFARQPRRLWWAGVLGLICAAYNLFSTEYFFGLELLRPFLLWLGLRQGWPEWKPRLKRTALSYLPFFLTLLGYLYWRYFVLGFYLYQPALVSELGESPVSRFVHLPRSIWEQWQVASWEAWEQVFQVPDFSAYGPRLTLIYLVVLLLTGIGLYGLVKLAREDVRAGWRFVFQWAGLGLVAMLLAGIPFLVTDLPLKLTFPNSRFTLPFALGVSFLLVALLTLIPDWNKKLLLASALVALAVGLQFNNGYLWREDWKLQKSFFWQMAWRIPDLEQGSILLSSDTPFDYSSDNSLTFPLNLIYAPENHSTKIDYAYFFVSVRLGNELEALKPGLPIHQDYLAATFDSSSDQIVAVHYSPPGCFRVLHPLYDQDLPLAPSIGDIADRWLEAGVPVLPRTAADALVLSNPEQIISKRTGTLELPAMLGPEPEHQWCYYFEKADLARQAGDWAQVAEIGDQVFSIPYYPDDFSEYLSFIEAYARIGRWEDARELTRRTANFMPILRPALCAIWQRVEHDPESSIGPAQIEKMKEEIGVCPLP
ncbi:MAG: hypothetical protein PVJ21_19805 [Anaerolineales bacterium]|jgi:hypothetical protein